MNECYPSTIREEELKNRVAADFFGRYDCTRIVGNIDFCVSAKARDTNQMTFMPEEPLFWAEAKNHPTDVHRMLAQLVLTIHGESTHLDTSPAELQSQCLVLRYSAPFPRSEKGGKRQRADESNFIRSGLYGTARKSPQGTPCPRTSDRAEGIRIWLFKAIAICGNRLVIGGTTVAKSAMKFQGVRWEARRLGMHAVKKD